MNIQIVEKNGIIVENKEIKLGQETKKLMSELKNGEVFEDTYYFFDGNLAISSEGGLVSYIELRGEEGGDICAIFHGIDLFRCEKQKVLEFMEQKNAHCLKQEDTEYIADNLGISVSFGISEEEVEDLELSAKRDGVYEDMLEDIKKDRYRSQHIEIIGIR